MARQPFAPEFSHLPDVIPIFPLAGVLLLPRGSLPLNIFEDRYLAMTADVLKTDDRMIGMIQPTGADDADSIAVSGRNGPALYDTGCAGRLVQFAESRDGRYMITLAGILRFRVAEELDMARGYRRVRPDWSAFEADMEEEYRRGQFDRDRLLAALEQYFKAHKIDPNWKAIRDMGDRMLVTSLAMGCPFDPSEKQALLEATALPARAEVLTSLLEMSGGLPDTSEGTRH
jgi:hypothetical protein